MRSRSVALVALLVLSSIVPLTAAKPGMGVHFGNGNVPAGCSTASTSGPRFTDGCYHMRTGLNSLDTPIIDVLLTVPVSTYPERDLRTMRQAVEMWDQGIQYLAPQMGLGWLDGVEFRIFLDDDKITTDPAWDPEIVVVVTNPVGGAGIGIDPLGFSAPCRGANPLAGLGAWNSLPGFQNDHGSSGTYVEPCVGGGTTCYAVNGAIDPLPNGLDFFTLYDLVAHEFGHCLTVGHVGDALDHDAATVPTADIMAYTNRPHDKCVSTLDVESFALRMSRFLLPAPLTANHASGPGGAFQIQHPRDHYYASSTGLPADCPQPADGLLPPSSPPSFTPTSGTTRAPPGIDVTSHADGDAVAAGPVTIAGAVGYGTVSPGGGSGSARGESAPAAPGGYSVSFVDGGAPPNTFKTTDSTFGVKSGSETFALAIPKASDVTIRLAWSSAVGFDDLDLYVTGAATGQSAAALSSSEVVTLASVPAGTLTIRVEPYQINDPAGGATYTLVAELAPKGGAADADGDGVGDALDACPGTPAGAPVDATGCAPGPNERVVIRVNGAVKASELVLGDGGDTFSQSVDLAGLSGPVSVEVTWWDGPWVVARETLTLVAG